MFKWRRAEQEIKEVISIQEKKQNQSGAYIWMEMTVVLQVDEKYRKDETRKDSKYNVIISALWGKSSS